jgi:hypothetical protein
MAVGCWRASAAPLHPLVRPLALSALAPPLLQPSSQASCLAVAAPIKQASCAQPKQARVAGIRKADVMLAAFREA